MTTTRYRAWTEEPGLPLLTPYCLHDQALSRTAFAERSGLGFDQLTFSILTEFAMPKFLAEGPKGLPGLKPEMLAHPLVWLPRRLAGRYVMERDGNGAPVVLESVDHHLVRVAVEMDLTGLYDEPLGQWADCFSIMGLDPDDDETMSRAQAWLDGEYDELFESFDLDTYLHFNEAASDVIATGLMNDLYVNAWALQAENLAAFADLIVKGDTSDHPTRELAMQIAVFADFSMPTTPIEGYDDWQPWDYFTERLETCEDDFVEAVVERLGEQLLTVRGHYWPIMSENLHEIAPQLAGLGIDTSTLASPEMAPGRPEGVLYPLPTPETDESSGMLAIAAAAPSEDEGDENAPAPSVAPVASPDQFAW